ncbi:hypothetical protein V6N12_039211 [Hibiscus sabdariffa]|uniref:Uncharacterized protein n=1 Tax=Hibiscus sabdariffa TaxID=183260 RepID=A0ABR2E1A7_9ROSI
MEVLMTKENAATFAGLEEVLSVEPFLGVHKYHRLKPSGPEVGYCTGSSPSPAIRKKNAIYLVDTVIGGPMLMYPCKPALESACITKVIHDRNRKRHSEALFFQFGIKLNNVMSTQVLSIPLPPCKLKHLKANCLNLEASLLFGLQIAYALIEQQERRMKLPDGHISYVGLLADPC